MNNTNGIEAIPSDSEQMISRSDRHFDRVAIYVPNGARMLVEKAAQHVRHSDPIAYGVLKQHAVGNAVDNPYVPVASNPSSSPLTQSVR